LAGHPLFARHVLTAPLWGFSALQDQQLGGVFMWVPGIVLFLWMALRSLSGVYKTLEPIKPA
jgi:putative membrane protein